MAKQLQSGDTRVVDRFSSILPPTRRTALSLAIAVALGMPGMVHAQDAPAAEGELEEIVVTGIRAGIQSAIATKQEAMSIVESISAEDIGKLPDTSIAESISRLPGLTSQRAEGRASAISLRGTDPGFTSALLNGREQATTGDNRNVEFDQYPSELISQVIVYKTPDSKLIGQGLAGTIDMRTVRPLDYGKQAVVLNLRGEMNDNDDLGADSDDTGLPRQLLVHRPVHGRQARPRHRLCAPRLADRHGGLRHVRAVECRLAAAAARPAAVALTGRLREQSGRCGRQLRHRTA